MTRTLKRFSAVLFTAVMSLLLISSLGALQANADDKTVGGLNLNLDLNKIDLNAKLAESKVYARAKGALSLDAQTEGVVLGEYQGVDAYDWEEASPWSGVDGDSTENVSPWKVYYAIYTLKLSSGYEWPSEVKKRAIQDIDQERWFILHVAEWPKMHERLPGLFGKRHIDALGSDWL